MEHYRIYDWGRPSQHHHQAVSSLRTGKCGHHEIVISSTSLSKMLNGQGLGPSSTSRRFLSKPKSLHSDPSLRRNPQQGPCDIIQQSVFSLYGTKRKSNRYQSINNGPTSPYRKQERIHSLPSVPLSNGASRTSKRVEEVNYPNGIYSTFCFVSALLICFMLSAPRLSDWYQNSIYQDSPSFVTCILCDTPDSVQAECRNLLVNHSSNHCLKT